MNVHVEMRNISHHFDGARALADVSITLERGTVHALVGENGAGKSTLGKILAGVVSPSDGTILLSAKTVRFARPRDALDAGVALVHQEISLAPSLSVLDNVFLGADSRWPRRRRRQLQRARLLELMNESGLYLDPDARVDRLRVAEQQLVEILRALARDAELIIMDEPTAPLSPSEVAPLMALIKRLRERGTTVVYVSHKLDEVLELADTITVLKDGALVETMPNNGVTADRLITSMLGRTLSSTFPDMVPARGDAPVVLDVRGLGRARVVQDVSLQLRAGEIVGLAGLVGSGRTELARMLFGADPHDTGVVEIGDRQVRLRGCRQAVKAGIAMLPEDRKCQGLVMNLSIRDNINLPSLSDLGWAGTLNPRREKRSAVALAEMVDIRATGVEQTVSSLSGGNQQKVALGKWLRNPPTVLILDEPTRGVDVGAKRSIYELITKLAADGMAVLVVSSDLLEVIGLSHRILVMHRGRLVAELPSGAEEEQILSAAFGRTSESAQA